MRAMRSLGLGLGGSGLWRHPLLPSPRVEAWLELTSTPVIIPPGLGPEAGLCKGGGKGALPGSIKLTRGWLILSHSPSSEFRPSQRPLREEEAGIALC